VAAVVYNPIKVDLKALREVVTAQASAAGWAEALWFELRLRIPGKKRRGALSTTALISSSLLVAAARFARSPKPSGEPAPVWRCYRRGPETCSPAISS